MAFARGRLKVLCAPRILDEGIDVPEADQLRRQACLPEPENAAPPYHLGKCIAWDFDGPVVQRHYPRFAGWQPLKRKP